MATATWGHLAEIATVVAAVAGALAWSRRHAKRGLRKLGTYLEDRMANIAAQIADPIVTEVSHLRRSIERTNRTVTEAEAECRMDREALWAKLGGRPGRPNHHKPE